MNFGVILDEPWLIAHFPKPQNMLSWSITRPGLVKADTVAWLQVHDRDLPPDFDPTTFFRERLRQRNMDEAVGLMTSRFVRFHHRATRQIKDITADCLMTLDLGNGTHVDEDMAFSDPHHRLGTINLLCSLSVPLSQSAMIEASCIAAQARTAAILEANIYLPGHRLPVTGTGTDCIVIACSTRADKVSYAGLHTATGQAIASCVYAVSRDALRTWVRQRPSRLTSQTTGKAEGEWTESPVNKFKVSDISIH